VKLNFKLRKEKAQGEEAFKEMMREEGSLVEFLDVKKWSVPRRLRGS
jgi:hypothetical protein